MECTNGGVMADLLRDESETKVFAKHLKTKPKNNTVTSSCHGTCTLLLFQLKSIKQVWQSKQAFVILIKEQINVLETVQMQPNLLNPMVL